MSARVMLTAGEQAVLKTLFPSYRWERGLVTISEKGLTKIRVEHAELERHNGIWAGTKKFSADKAYQAEMLGRVISKCEQAVNTAEPSANLR